MLPEECDVLYVLELNVFLIDHCVHSVMYYYCSAV